MNFRSVVVDECAQATEPEVVLCVMRLLDWIFGIGPDTFDGRNPAPVEVGSLSHYVRSFKHPRQDFFHQQDEGRSADKKVAFVN